jgi:hypothetical protein
MPSFASAAVLTNLAAATVAANGNSAAVDIGDYQQECLVTLATSNTAGTNPTLAVKLQHASDGDIVTSVTPGSNTGNGTVTQVYGRGDTVAENITITFSNATTFAVSGSVTGAMAGGTVGTLYSNAQIEFLITAGTAAFINGDTFVIATTARTYADVDDGAFTGATSGGLGQKLVVEVGKIGRWMRLNYTIGGTVSPSYRVVSTILGIK